MSAGAFEVRGLTVFLEGPSGMRRVLDGVDLLARAGKTFALLGESGSGKTCLVQSVLGLHSGEPGVVAGEAVVLGRDVFGDLPRRFVTPGPTPLSVTKDMVGWRRGLEARWKDELGRAVTFIPQDAITSISPFHTVEELLIFAVRRGNPSISREEARDAALGWLRRVEMYDVEAVSGRFIHELSGGMAQRVAIALALAPRPSLLIADEPTTGLDATLRIQLIKLLASVVETEGVTLFLVTHDNAAARLLASDVAVLFAGQLMESGPCAQVLGWETTPKHPYTRYLLDAERRLTEGLEIPYRARDRQPGPGCPFAPYCESAAAACQRHPPLREGGEGHRIACWEVTP